MTQRNEYDGVLLTKREFAEELKISTRTVDRYIKDGLIKAEKVGRAGLIRIERSEIDRITSAAGNPAA